MLENLTHLDLSHTVLQCLSEILFATNTKLTMLNLSQTYIGVMPDGLLKELQSLEILDLSHIPTTLRSFQGSDVFSHLRSLTKLHVVHAEICCLAPGVHCISDHPSFDIFGSCKNYIANIAILAILYVYSVSNVLCNALSFVWLCKDVDHLIISKSVYTEALVKNH